MKTPVRFFPLLIAILMASFAVETRAASSLPAEIAPLKSAFKSARPIWPEAREKEKNLFVGFRASFTASEGVAPVTLRMAGSSLYRVALNGRFVGHGPARGPHGFYRQDEWDLRPHLKPGENLLAVEVAGYNVNSYYLLDQPAFLQAEIVCEGRVLASTAGEGVPFEAAVLSYHRQKVQRYSFQRPFVEVYRLTPGFDAWRTDPKAEFQVVTCTVAPEKAILSRGVPYPAFHLRPAVWQVAAGRIESLGDVKDIWKDRSLVNIGPQLGGYPESELEIVPTIELQKIKSLPTAQIDKPLSADETLRIEAGEYSILDFGTNLTGFPGAAIRCERKTRVYLTFDEILSQGDVDFKRLGCASVLTWDLEPGEYRVEAFEPYTMRYVKLISLDSAVEVRGVTLREMANPDVHQAQFSSSDPGLNKLFEAARETYRQNAPDVFTDCPSRERAGWLCDSFFTARVAFDFSGAADIERAFIQNYALPEKFDFLPDGMLPMCYPADHNDGVYIPNWALWLVVELDEYAARSGDRGLVEAMEPKVMNLFKFFEKYRNSDGLLEKLPSWVFVEWSKANELVQDVNYPSNMLYAGALDAAARLYGREELSRQAAQIRDTIHKQSFDGEFFVDNAMRKNDKLEITRNRTEVCQYYAFFFGVATPESHAPLWEKLLKGFGPDRQTQGGYPEIHPANAFIGNYLRLELLSRYGQVPQLLNESKGYLLKMANQTGTLWEHDKTVASCNHGFASHVAHVLVRDVLGLYRVDTQQKAITLRFSNLPLDWCAATLPVAGGFVRLEWQKNEGRIEYKLDLPSGYRVQVESGTGIESVRKP